MSELFGDDFITITDEDGQEYELEVLCSVEYRGCTYLGVCPAGSDEDGEELEVSVLKVTEEDGEELLEAVTDEDELAAVYELLLNDYENEEESEEDP